MKNLSLKAFTLYLMVLALALVAAGLTLYLTNQPDPSLSDNLVRAALNLPAIYDRSFRMGIGEMLLVAGGVLFLAGGVGWLVARNSSAR